MGGRDRRFTGTGNADCQSYTPSLFPFPFPCPFPLWWSVGSAAGIGISDPASPEASLCQRASCVGEGGGRVQRDCTRAPCVGGPEGLHTCSESASPASTLPCRLGRFRGG